MKKNRDNESTEGNPHHEKDNQSSPQLTPGKRIRSGMEVAIYIAGALCVAMTIASATAGALGHKELCIWTGCGAWCFLGVAGAFWLHDVERKRAGATKERAMVVPIAFSGEPKVGEPFQASVRFKNTSHIVAKDVRIVFKAYGIPKEKKPDFDLVDKEPPKDRGAVLVKDAALTAYHPEKPIRPLTAIDVAEVENGNVVIYAFGKIYYRDTPACSHWTTFCVFYMPSLKRYSDYGEYNDTDEVKCP